jgi:hypothetical protein
LIHVDLEVDALTLTATQELMDALVPHSDGSRPQIVDVRQIRTGAGPDAPDEVVTRLADLSPEQVFVRLYRNRLKAEPEAEVLQAFRALLSENP